MEKDDKMEEVPEAVDNITLDEFVYLVMDYELTDPIDFGTVAVEEKAAFRAVCQGVLETIRNTPKKDRMIVLMVALAKVLLEAEIHKLQRIQYLKPLNF